MNTIRKSLSLVLATVMLLALIGVGTSITAMAVSETGQATSNNPVGDVDGSGAVDTNDLTYLDGVFAGTNTDMGCCDVDGNRMVELADRVALENILAGKPAVSESMQDDLLTSASSIQMSDAAVSVSVQSVYTRGDSKLAVKVQAESAAGTPYCDFLFAEAQDWSDKHFLYLDALFINEYGTDSDQWRYVCVALLTGADAAASDSYKLELDAEGEGWDTGSILLQDISGTDLSAVKGIRITFDFAEYADSSRWESGLAQGVYLDNVKAVGIPKVDTTLTVNGYKLQKTVSLAGQTVTAASALNEVSGVIGEDGNVVLSLIEDEVYTITVDGYASQTVTGGVDTSVMLQYIFFTPNAAFDLSKQNDGQFSLINGGSGNLLFNGTYTDFAFTMNVKDHPDAATAAPRTELMLKFADGQVVTFGVTTHATAGYDFIQSMGGGTYLLGWGNHGSLTTAESALYRSADGVDFTVMRRGQYITLFIGSRAVKVVDMSAYIAMDTEVSLEIRHWDDAGVRLDYTFTFEEYIRVPVTITGHRNGENNNLSGVTVKVANAYEIVWPAYNKNGELVASLIEGIDYQFLADGYVSKIINVQKGSAVQLEYNLFTANADWDLTKQNDGRISLLNGGTTDLWFAQQYTDFKFTINVKDHPDAVTAVPRNQLLIMFADGQMVTFDVTTHATAGYDFIQSFGGSSYLLSWANHGALTTEETAQYRSTEGVDFTVVRNGTVFYLFIGDRLVKTVDMSSYITADTKATLRFRHWDDAGVKLDYDICFIDKTYAATELTVTDAVTVNGQVSLVGEEITVSNGAETFVVTLGENGIISLLLEAGKTYTVSTPGYVTQEIVGGSAATVQFVTDEATKIEVSTDASALTYCNDLSYGGADPFVLDMSSVNGYYYLYTTGGNNIQCSRSADLENWEYMGSVVNLGAEDSVERRVLSTNIWAMEVVYDSGTYYAFLSATPEKDTTVASGQGVTAGTASYQMLVATSISPTGPFTLVNFKKATSCGTANLHTFNQRVGLTDSSGNYINAYPHYYAPYSFFDPAQIRAFAQENEASYDANLGGYQCAIDPHPYVDPVSGNKYLYWTANGGDNAICVVQMKTWLKPMWETATVVARTHYYTVEDYETAKTDPDAVTLTPYDPDVVNEGQTVVYNASNGKYYLTYSSGDYRDSTYQVIQAVGNSPVGPFRKLTVEEGGILLSANYQTNGDVAGTGHHSFVTIGDETYIVYHRLLDVDAGNGVRMTAIDKVQWIDVTDIQGNTLKVMYVNGPTTTAQPLPASVSGYQNIAGDATVSCANSITNIKSLTDGLLSIHSSANATFQSYIGEAVLTQTSTIRFDFDEARSVAAIMVYESTDAAKMFSNVKRIFFAYVENGKTKYGCVDNIALSKDMYAEDGTILPGAAIFAQFEELQIISLSITVEVPDGQTQIAISDIQILGK